MGVWMEELKLGSNNAACHGREPPAMLLDTTDWDEARDLPIQMAELDQFLAAER